MSILRECFILLLVHFCLFGTTGASAKHWGNSPKLIKRDVSPSKIREKAHVQVLKFFSGNYDVIPSMTEIEENQNDTTKQSTEVSFFIRSTTPSPPDQIEMNIFGGYFNSVLGIYLAKRFNVTLDKSSTPSFAMAHYFFPGGFSVPHNGIIGEASIVNCTDVVNFCVPNSVQTCLSNGTIYCVTPLESTRTCFLDGSLKRCLDTTVKLPCSRQNFNKTCEKKSPCPKQNVTKVCEKRIPLHLPCYVKLRLVENDECIKKKIYKMTYCVTTIAYPIKKYNNGEFIEYLHGNEDGKRIVSNQVNSLLDAILNYVVH